MPPTGYVARLRRIVGQELLLLPSVTAVVPDDAGAILLVLHSELQAWVAPGGTIEPGETPADAAVHETWEETGLRVAPLRVAGVFGGDGFTITYANGDRAAYVTTVFECRVVGGSARPDGAETTAVRWVAPSELDELPLAPSVRLVLPPVLAEPARAAFAPPRRPLDRR